MKKKKQDKEAPEAHAKHKEDIQELYDEVERKTKECDVDDERCVNEDEVKEEEE